nr:MFS transporter [Bacilli bacterium]
MPLEKATSNSYRWIVFATVVIGTFMVNVDSSIVNVALPILQMQYHIAAGILQWVVTGYLLMITAILPMVGSLSDRLDRKKMFILGIFIFTVSSALCALAINFSMLVLFRFLQAIGGALIQANVMSIVSFTFPEGQRGRPLGLIGSVVALGTIVGPALGGVLIAAMGWRSIFWVNVPFGILSIVVSALLLKPISKGIGVKGFDWWGSGWFILATVTLMIFVSNGGSFGWTSLYSLLFIIVSLISWAVFIVREQKFPKPLIELSMFRIWSFSIGNIVGFLSFVIMMFPAMLLPLFLHHIMHLSVSSMGLLLMAQSIVMVLFAPIGGLLSDRIGHYLPTVLGMVLITVSMIMMDSLAPTSGIVMIVLIQALLGAGLGLFSSPNNVVVLEAVPVEKTGLTGSLIATIRNLGRVSGVAVAMLLFQVAVGNLVNYPQNTFMNGMHLVFGGGIVLSVLGTILVIIRRKS